MAPTLPPPVPPHVPSVGYRLSFVRNLCLDMCKSATAECLVDVLSHMPQLQTLSANWTLANDDVVAAVCRVGKSLRELSLQGCVGVTDGSVDALVGTDDVDTDDVDNNVGIDDDDDDVTIESLDRLRLSHHCRLPLPQLTSLNVTATRVSTKGLRRILKRLTELRHLYHEVSYR